MKTKIYRKKIIIKINKITNIKQIKNRNNNKLITSIKQKMFQNEEFYFNNNGEDDDKFINKKKNEKYGLEINNNKINNKIYGNIGIGKKGDYNERKGIEIREEINEEIEESEEKKTIEKKDLENNNIFEYNNIAGEINIKKDILISKNVNDKLIKNEIFKYNYNNSKDGKSPKNNTLLNSEKENIFVNNSNNYINNKYNIISYKIIEKK